MSSTTSRTRSSLPPEDLDLLLHANHWNPFGVLGPQRIDSAVVGGRAQSGSALVIRSFLPNARNVRVIDLRDGEPGTVVPMERVHDDGLFERIFEDRDQPFPYQLEIEDFEGHVWRIEDPYRFGPVLTDFDLHLLGEGTHYRNFERLGAHLRTHEGVQGVHFAVWAPNAMRVSVVGD
ncbi:MAG: 1,4-alpha-glucan branching enzyme, partial [Isosphaeraceae bacterium]